MFTHIIASIVTTQNKIKREQAEKEALKKNTNADTDIQPDTSNKDTNSTNNTDSTENNRKG